MFPSSHARASARRFPFGAATAALALFAASPLAAQDLGLSDVLARASRADPSQEVTGARVAAGEASIRQAEVGPRPVIGVDVEDFAGTGPYSPVDRSQTTAWYERTWERGGKREARIGAARAELSAVALRGRLRTLDYLAQVQTAWVEALAAQAAVTIADERLAFAERNARDIGYRVDRAIDPLFADERARTAVAQARIALDQARETARIARASLAAFWGGSEAFGLDLAPFQALAPVAYEAADMPDLALLAAERDTADARLQLEEARSVADPTLRAGVRHFGQGNEVALVVGGSIPLGSRSANRANVERARSERGAADAEIAVARLERQREIDRLSAERRAVAAEIGRIDREMLPGAERTVAMIRTGFNRGGTAFTLLELAEAQRVVTDARARRVELLRRFHLAGVRLDRLTGRHLSLVASAENRR
jgi:cobalt-zinc-cadmium efflux system outer membrane protein